MKELIHKWVKENYGQSEADNPSWDIDLLAEYIRKEFKNKADKWLDILCDSCNCVEELAEMYPVEYSKTAKDLNNLIDEMYNLTKGK